MKIALAQMNVVAGKCEQNFQSMEHCIAQAKDDGVDIIVFPEMCISGYLLQDKLLDEAFCAYVHSFNERILALSDTIGIIYGNLYHGALEGIEKGRDGRILHCNCAFFAHNQRWVKKENGIMDGMHIKHLNPDYRIFDDSRFYLSGMEVSNYLYKKMDALISPFLFTTKDKTYRIGLEVCEDIWSYDYSVDPTKILANQDVDFIVNVSASPYTRNKEISRNKQLLKHASELGDKMPMVIYVNAVGMQNNGKNVIVFDGDSTVFDTRGKPIFACNDGFKEEYAVYDFHSIRLDSFCENKILEALTVALYEFDKQMFPFQPKWIIGLSGGIDSCINAGLLVKALGANRVVGYNLATKYNSDLTKNNAKQVADTLGIELRNGSIEEVVGATEQTAQMYGYEKPYPSLVVENIQARVRGHMLSTFAALEGGVIVNNANKVEIAVGYCTLYGDSIGAISPIGDLTKVEVFELAKQINAYFGKEVISKTLIPEIKDGMLDWKMPPSAELKDAQIDPMKWYYHDELIHRFFDYPTMNVEAYLENYLDGSIYDEEIGKWIRYYHLDDGKAFIEDLEWFLKQIANSVFKRIQMPPIVSLSRGAFGNDYREAQLGVIQSKRYQELKEKILLR
ncbi:MULTISPECIES: NAD(+) synthase [unclassified Breznakia]|uniref:NAD(+) synthase n=1 Tax=unclassified Breznakia TaxID=2623764 RepID=UPI002476ABD2|nr:MULTISPECIES: NAD(+) synthase [unclassified Breznakia]MDH6366330.1 NAD+ synthase (glutamine-hydrolyzing) [Breznakia sp. PH1-1]MDH6403423.1 NAD+ synthase (glutamine-hydrolyzing) [Breznakia sp. PF1-11]MDH6411132.1 NAD+ synthase (glutamine-hydrolyzing) [Breznakia sp. PFB1-11]MDH6413605.1 NAD+ synthase (glutamine-hydrolyzing) [Breznakia sp. PFB1-14]MDH6415677.1 NAD+ synthase (glutamine-hydrolyzing) [Breznakia sp. PFB1-4]